MENLNEDELIANVINHITEKVSQSLLNEFLQLPKDQQLNIILIKSAQLLLANILCHIVTNTDELNQIIENQAVEIKTLTINCAYTGFAHKFNINKH